MKFSMALLSLLFFCSNSFSQKSEDNTIVVTVSDTSNLYNRVRQAITFTNLVIRDVYSRDTLITLSERIHGFDIFVVTRVIIDGVKISISGAYGLGLEDFWGLPRWPKSYKPIVYFKGSEAWQIIRQIAIKLDSKMEYFRN